MAAYGGVGIGPQKAALALGVEVVVGCPGRLLDLCGQQLLALDRVEALVLDEADCGQAPPVPTRGGAGGETRVRCPFKNRGWQCPGW